MLNCSNIESRRRYIYTAACFQDGGAYAILTRLDGDSSTEKSDNANGAQTFAFHHSQTLVWRAPSNQHRAGVGGIYSVKSMGRFALCKSRHRWNYFLFSLKDFVVCYPLKTRGTTPTHHNIAVGWNKILKLPFEFDKLVDVASRQSK